MQLGYSRLLLILLVCGSSLGWGQIIQGTSEPSAPPPPAVHNGGDFSTVTKPDPKNVVPKDTILVKGAWSSASDSTTPLPEGGAVKNNVFTDAYFGITYPLPPDWFEKYTPPPPSDSGSYVLTLISRPDTYKGEAKGSIQFTAQDMFFTPVPAANARQLVNYSRDHLPEYYQVEMKPTTTTIAGQPFMFFAYWSPVAQLHWYVLATEIRCHTVEIILMNRDPKTLEQLVLDLSKNMKLPAEANPTGGTGGGNLPVCIKDYATGDNVIERAEPILTVHRYNAIPVRIVIDKNGKVKHIHFLSAFPDQEKAISEALKQWKFRPYERNGERLEVETGIMFGRPSLPVAPPPGTQAVTE
jgi:hypothetical protein